jgi:hypothetical protein
MTRALCVFCIRVICAAYCCLLHTSGGLVREESPVFLSPEKVLET